MYTQNYNQDYSQSTSQPNKNNQYIEPIFTPYKKTWWERFIEFIKRLFGF